MEMSTGDRVDILLVQVSQSHLFLAIVILILLSRLFEISPPSFDVALFSCVSTPVTYSITYYSSRAYRMGRFVTTKMPRIERVWLYEVVALTLSFFIGWLVFLAFTSIPDFITYSIAFMLVQIMRVMAMAFVKMLSTLGISYTHPLMTLLIAFLIAIFGFVLVFLLFSAPAIL